MKRSEALKIVHEYTAGVTAQASAEELLRRLEGPLSIDYEPEELPLPEWLEVRVRGECACVDALVGGQLKFLVCVTVGNWSLSDSERSRIVIEAVRRWNAWPELRRLAQNWYDRGDRATADFLVSILDGEGE